MAVTSESFSSIHRFTIRNRSGAFVQLSNLGASVVALHVPDRAGILSDVVLGYASADAYLNAAEHPYFGATIGRFANRINRGVCPVDGAPLRLEPNAKGHHLHGGMRGFDRAVWAAEPGDDFVTFRLHSPDGDQNYPGAMDVEVIYTWSDDSELRIDYTATVTRPCPVNLTNHAYFNLAGEGSGSILDHEVQIRASHITAVNADCIPDGSLLPVENTPLDFLSPKPVGRDIDADHPQIRIAGGYDHNYVLDRKAPQMETVASVFHPGTGRLMEVDTTEPGLQFYTGNHLTGKLIGKSGYPYPCRSALCLETQHFPDSPNHPEFPESILRPGQTLKSITIYRFLTR